MMFTSGGREEKGKRRDRGAQVAIKRTALNDSSPCEILGTRRPDAQPRTFPMMKTTLLAVV